MPTRKKSSSKKSSQKPLKRSVFKNPWFYSTIVLLVVLAGFILYDRSIIFHKSINSFLGLENTIAEKPAAVNLTVISDKTIKDMPYNLDEQITSLKEEIDAEIKSTKIDISDSEAEKLIEDFDIKTIPVLIFDKNLEETQFFTDARAFFLKNGDYYIMRTKPVKFLETPKPGDGHIKGVPDDSAPVTIIAYNSLSCPYCTMMKDVFYQALDEYPDKIRYIYKHYDRGGSDLLLSGAAECAGEQEKFWEMHNFIYDNHEKLKNDGIEVFLKDASDDLSLDYNSLETCIEGNNYSDLINTQTEEAYLYGINGTPGIFINDTFIGGAASYDTIEEVINSYIQ